jgi:hypothetical protein
MIHTPIRRMPIDWLASYGGVLGTHTRSVYKIYYRYWKPVASEHLIIGQINENRPVRALNECSEYINIVAAHEPNWPRLWHISTGYRPIRMGLASRWEDTNFRN